MKDAPEKLYTLDDLNHAAQYAGGSVYQLVMETLANAMDSARKGSVALLSATENGDRQIRAKAVLSALQSIVISLGQIEPGTFDWGPEIERLIELARKLEGAKNTGEHAVP